VTIPRSRPRRDWPPGAGHADADTVVAAAGGVLRVEAVAGGASTMDIDTPDKERRQSDPITPEANAEPLGRATVLAIDLLPEDGGPDGRRDLTHGVPPS
jgi:hypothetical protein